MRGRVVRQSLEGPVPLPQIRVVLHGIGATSGPLDSTVADAGGRYAFRVSGDSSKTYLPTARWGGITYFGESRKLGDASGDNVIAVFDTTSQPIPIHVLAHHLVVAAPDAAGRRRVMEVFELENDTVVTWVAGGGARAALSLGLPSEASEVSSPQGDFQGTATNIRGDSVDVVSPVAPGLRQWVISYMLPASAFPLRRAVPSDVGVLEVLLEEPDAAATAGGLTAMGAVTYDGRNFVRFLAQNASSIRDVLVTTPASSALPRGAIFVFGLGIVALVGAARYARKPAST